MFKSKMETLKFNNLNSLAIIKGSEKRRSVTLKKAALLKGHNQRANLKLRLPDEKDMPAFSRNLDFNADQPEIELDAELVFYGHMSIEILNPAPQTPFEIEISFE